MKDIPGLLTDKINHKKILITGGTTGIGRATAILLAEVGATVMVVGRHQQPIDETLTQVRVMNAGRKHIGLALDLSEKHSIDTLYQTIDDEWGELDVLINNVALPAGNTQSGSYEEWQYLVNTNLMSYIACSHEAISRMKNKREGHIINIGSMSAEVKDKDSSLYVATKSAIRGYSASLRKECNPLGIHVSLIEPGLVDTDMHTDSAAEKLRQVERKEMLKAGDIALSALFCLLQDDRCSVIEMKVRPLNQLI